MALRITPFCFRRRATPRLEAPRGTSTKTPSLENVPKGFSTEYHTNAAAAPHASKTSTSRIARNFISAGLRRSLAGALQIIAENNGGGDGVHSELCGVPVLGCAVELFGFAAELFFQQALGFPAGQPFIGHFDVDADLFAHALRKAFGFVGHFAAAAVKAQRQADQN